MNPAQQWTLFADMVSKAGDKYERGSDIYTALKSTAACAEFVAGVLGISTASPPLPLDLKEEDEVCGEEYTFPKPFPHKRSCTKPPKHQGEHGRRGRKDDAAS